MNTAPRGIFDSLKRLVDRVVALLHGRTELLTTELEEDLTRFIGVMLWSLVAVFAALIALTFLAVMALLIVPPQYRSWGAAVIALLFLILAGFGWRSIRRIARAKPRPLDATLTELEKDLAKLRSER